MASIGALTASLKPSTASRVTVVDMTTGGTEYSHALLQSCKSLSFQLMDDTPGAKVRFTFNDPGGTADGQEYMTLKTGCAFCETGFELLNFTLYVRCNKDSQKLAILEWA